MNVFNICFRSLSICTKLIIQIAITTITICGFIRYPIIVSNPIIPTYSHFLFVFSSLALIYNHSIKIGNISPTESEYGIDTQGDIPTKIKYKIHANHAACLLFNIFSTHPNKINPVPHERTH